MLPQEMKRHAVIVVLAAKHSDLKISNFLHVARSFVHKIRLEFKGCDGNVSCVAKRKKHSHRSDSVRIPEFIWNVQNIIGENAERSMRSIAKEPQVSE